MKFFRLFDQKKFMSLFLLTCLFILLLSIFTHLDLTLSKYQSGANSTAKAKVAYFVINPGKYQNGIALSGLEPSDTPYTYQIAINNFDTDVNRAQVNLKYTIKFIFTTNLPLTYKVIRNADYTSDSISIMTSDTTSQDASGVYYRTLSNNNEYTMSFKSNVTDTYTLVVNFPKEYSSQPEIYQGLIDSCTIEINAEQVV